jgi:Rubredoxin-like zinc ribbon domain (DUF35_N)
MATAYGKPLARPFSPEVTRPFWEAATRHELVMPRCKIRDHLFFYPRLECPRCLSNHLEWMKLSGRGRLRLTFRIARRMVTHREADHRAYGVPRRWSRCWGPSGRFTTCGHGPGSRSRCTPAPS